VGLLSQGTPTAAGMVKAAPRTLSYAIFHRLYLGEEELV
jgi:hypothetical protein